MTQWSLERDSQPVFRLMWNRSGLAHRRYFYSEGEAVEYLARNGINYLKFRLHNVRTAEELASSEAASGGGPARGS